MHSIRVIQVSIFLLFLLIFISVSMFSSGFYSSGLVFYGRMNGELKELLGILLLVPT